VKEVLCKYGLEKDQQALYALGVHSVSDIPWITADDLLDPRLKGTPAQYLAMQEGEYVEDTGETSQYPMHLGATARIHGLVGNPEHNGVTGKVVSTLQTGGGGESRFHPTQCSH
jgi:hypothetical protein